MPTGPKLLLVAVLVGHACLAEVPSRTFTAEERSWWAIQPVSRPVVPADGAGWARNEIDSFVAARLASAALQPAREAGRPEMVRRAYFDLHGLPPTPEQVAAFVNDGRPDAWERLIDELLASPRYGERWGQHWLDVVRFAESDGYRQDAFRPDAFRYRDWVVKSFNQDKPYNKFVAQQLAGDEIDADDPDSLIGTAFLRNGLYEYNQRDVRFHWELILNEVTNVTAEAFLGLGIGCAQCHDHKFDPLLQKDYYRLQAYLAPMRMRHDLPLATARERRAYAEKLRVWEEATGEIREKIDAIVEPRVQKAMNASLIKFPPDIQDLFAKEERERTPYEQQLVELARIQLDYERERFNENGIKGEEQKRLQALRAELAKFDALKPQPLPRAFVATDVRTVPPVVPLGGRPGVGTGNTRPGVPSIIDPSEERIEFESPESTGRRLALATWITDAENPLTARVMVNRLWQHHFERGIVATPNDFGSLGELPSHPALLDWLALRFVESGWRMKPIHRLIMTSATYRQTARAEPDTRAEETDPENRLLWRYPPRRLDAEQVRDAMLAASGELKLELGGKSVVGTTPRRSIYVKKIRNSPDDLLKGFDAPLGFDSAATRSSTTTAIQSLQLLNGEWTTARAAAFARRLLDSRSEVNAEMIRRAYLRALGREPEPGEVEGALAFVSLQQSRLQREVDQKPKFPGTRPIGLQFGELDAALVGRQELQLQPGSPYERLELEGLALKRDEFSVEAIVVLDALYPDADVRTLVSRWNGDKSVAGWTFGVTSEKSKYKPRNFIMQLIGRKEGGEMAYEVVASNLRVPLGRPLYLAATVSTTPSRAGESGGTVTFYLKDLSDPQSRLEVKRVPHSLVQGIQDPDVPIILGGREDPGRALWDGEVARLTIDEGIRSPEQLFLQDPSARGDRLLDMTFSGEAGKPVIPSAKWLPPSKPVSDAQANPLLGALADFCHALLSSNEFLYLH